MHLDVTDAVVCRVHVEMRVAERVDMRLQSAHLRVMVEVGVKVRVRGLICGLRTQLVWVRVLLLVRPNNGSDEIRDARGGAAAAGARLRLERHRARDLVERSLEQHPLLG